MIINNMCVFYCSTIADINWLSLNEVNTHLCNIYTCSSAEGLHISTYFIIKSYVTGNWNGRLVEVYVLR